MATLNRNVLDYLFRQVTINYLNDAGNPAPFNYSQLTSALDPSGIREVNGANNNLVGHGDLPGSANPPGTPGDYAAWGTADSPFLNISIGQPVSSSPNPGYNTPGGAIADGDPRLISNLISTMFSTGANANPAAVTAAAASEGGVIDPLDPNGTVFIPDPGVLGGARFNQWFTAFGQFFDHGLDFIVRDPSATAKITIELSPNDPLYSLGADGLLGGTGANRDVTSITVTRAGVANVEEAGLDNTFGTADDVIDKGADGVVGGGDDALSGTSDVFAKAVYTNNTGLLIDQSQTYGSVASVNALIREYDASGRPTGRVVTHNTAALTDADTGNDATAKGLQTWADVKANALRIGVELSNMDVLNGPVLKVDPAGKLLFTPDPAAHYTTASLPTDPGYNAATDPFMRNPDGTVMKTGHAFLLDMGFGANPAAPGFNAALLDAHYISGDGRTNENVGLTAVHEVFHEEHNLNIANLKTSIAAEAAAIGGTAGDAYLHAWQIETSPGVWSWDGEKLFQAARIITESEYNHIAVAEYIRSLAPALPEFVSYSTDINLGVSLEFSQAVFRLGHSMLTETFNVTDPTTGQNLKLLDAFLNPTLYAQMDPAALAQGLAKTVANMPDEFVTPALQQSLLGQPLDLAAINIARGRDVGLPTLNELREQIYTQVIQNTSNASGSAVAPYTSWSDFGAHMSHPESLVNFIAAYARGADTTGLTGDALRTAELGNAVADLRDAYMAGTATLADIRAAAQHILDAAGDVLNSDHNAALRFLGGAPVYNETTSTWDLTEGDQGFWDIDLWIGGLAERPLFDGPLGTTFSFVMLDFAQRMQDGDRFYYLYRQPFAHPLGVQVIAEQFTDVISRTMGIEHFGSAFGYADATFELGKTGATDNSTNDFFRASDQTITFVDGTTGAASDGHIVVAGNNGNDYIIAGNGDDVVYGDAGNDIIQGGQGNDYLLGGDGNDYITDDENDDHIRGGKGDDYIDAGGGILDLVLGEEGNDTVHGGVGIDEVYGGDGDDLVYGDGDTDKVFGENGNDYVDGGDGPDEMFGGAGNDWLRGGVGDDSLQGETGNDLLEGGLGPTANNGDVLIGDQPVGPIGTETFVNQGEGFDIATYEDAGVKVIASLNANGVRQGGLLDTYQLIEGLVGSRFGDELTGADSGNAGGNGIDNVLIGGAGMDVLIGLGGDDQLYGDSVIVRNDLSVWDGTGAAPTMIANWKGTGEVRADFGANGGLGHVLGDNGADSVFDRAVFSGARFNYQITSLGGDAVRIVDTRGIDSTAIGDTAKGIETFTFADGNYTLAQLLNSGPTLSLAGPATVVENAAKNTVVVGLNVADPDSDTVTLTLADSAEGRFSLVGNQLVVNAGILLDYERMPLADKTHSVEVVATDGVGGRTSLRFNVTVGDANENASISGGPGANSLNGTDGADRIYGLAGRDVLDGKGGADLLVGGAGRDTMLGGAGNDTYRVDYTSTGGGQNVGWDIVIEQAGEGNDTAIVTIPTQGNNLPAFYALFNNFENLVLERLAGDGLFGGIGSSIGTGAANIIRGSTGADLLDARAGNDLLLGDAGDDILEGDEGIDTLYGGIGNDRLEGGVQNDTLDGGADDDRYIGGGGADTLIFRGASGNDIIDGFDDGVTGPQDVLQFDAGVFATFANLQAAMSQQGADVLILLSPDNSVTILNTSLASIGAEDVRLI